jgi:hypothetical protein
VVTELDPVGDDAHRMRLGLETVSMHALLLQGSDDALHQTVLLRTVRRDERLLQPIAPYQPGVLSTREDQAIVGAQQERFLDASQSPVPADQRLLQGGCRSRGLVVSGKWPTQQFPAVAIDHQCHGQPAVPATPDPRQVRGPALIRCRCHRNVSTSNGQFVQS